MAAGSSQPGEGGLMASSQLGNDSLAALAARRFDQVVPALLADGKP
jgi:hypothetical protein